MDMPLDSCRSFDEVCQQIASELILKGWSVIPEFIQGAPLKDLRTDCLRDWQEGEFRHAGVGRGESFAIIPELRNDRVKWLIPGEESPAQAGYLEQLGRLRQVLNRSLYLGLHDYEGHLAVYPPGSFYARHLDQFQDTGLRTVSVILYLNDDWQAEDGGQLRLYTRPGDETRYRDILPLGGQLVAFMSADFVHEVLPARRERMSITGWFKRRDGASSF